MEKKPAEKEEGEEKMELLTELSEVTAQAGLRKFPRKTNGDS